MLHKHVLQHLSHCTQFYNGREKHVGNRFIEVAASFYLRYTFSSSEIPRRKNIYCEDFTDRTSSKRSIHIWPTFHWRPIILPLHKWLHQFTSEEMQHENCKSLEIKGLLDEWPVLYSEWSLKDCGRWNATEMFLTNKYIYTMVIP